MRRGILYKIALAIVVLFVVSCDPSPEKRITGTQDFTGVEFPITVYTYDSRTELNKAIKDRNPSKRTVEGLALWFLVKSTRDIKRCEIHVVTPRSIDDEHVLTWGHELAHCIYGAYHKEPK